MRDQQLHHLLKTNFGFESFRFEQFNIINSVIDGHDTLAIMPTGGGKSLCYQIPALYFDGITIVISPLISLMQDQVMNLDEYGVKALFLNSSLSYQEIQSAKERIAGGEVKIVYVSPEGILSSSLSNFFSRLKISLIAIDEAHCVSLWGHEFRKEYVRLGELKTVYPGVPMIALTATADFKTRVDIASQLQMIDPKVFVSSFDRPNIKYMILERHDEIKQLDDFIKNHHENDVGIVYCLSRDKVERVAKALKDLGYPAVPYHAGLTQERRQKNQKLFNTKEHIIVVATIAFGMGIDRPDVRFVAHLDLPKSVESYYQETGRAGRDGKPSTAWMIYGLQDVVKLSHMLETTDADDAYKRVARIKLDAMLALCETVRCRRDYLLRYFGEESREFCEYCDSCLVPSELWDATIDAQKILSTIYRTNQQYGAGHVIDVLRGSKSAKIIEKRHDQLSCYGVGQAETKEHWNTILRQLLNQNYIAIKNWEYRNLALTSKAKEIFSGKIQFKLRKQNVKELEQKKTRGRVDKKRTESRKSEGPLFDALKSLRSDLAKEKGVPAYIIFSDKSLHDMCLLKPRNKSEFLMVNGVGQTKLENYGDDFLEVLRQF